MIKPLSYQEFSENRRKVLRSKRKNIGVSLDLAENIIFGTRHSVGMLERGHTPNADRVEYILYIYDLVLEEADRTGKKPSDIFKELEIKR